MAARGYFVAVVLAQALFVSACGADDLPIASTATPSHFQGAGVSFDYPSTWNAATFEVNSSFSNLIVYLSTEQLADPCQRAPNSITCRSPIGGLSNSGLLVDWEQRSFPSFDFATVAGAPTAIGGRAAKVSAGPADEGCRAVGGESEVVATIPRPNAPLNWTDMRACLRGPALAELRGQVEAMLASVVWTP